MDDIWDDCNFLLTIALWSGLFVILKRKRYKQRRFWVRPIYENRCQQGDFAALFQELKDDSEMFFKYTRMTQECFYILLEMVSPKLEKHNWRALPPELRLSLTLRYLATGDQILSIALAYRIGESTARAIIKETTKVISSVLLPKVLQPPSEADYMRISAGFLEKWNFPNCLGSFDGKHCVIQAPSLSGSLYHNYKKTFSIVLMAACDSNYKFTLVDIGSYGSQNDAGIFYESEFGNMLRTQKLNVLRKKVKLPESNETAGYFFIGDEGFPLSINLMRPYSGRNLNENKKIFNYRLSRARRTIENAFGILVSRWRVLRKPICMHPNTVDKIILSTVCLHNFLKNFEEQQSATYNRVYCPPNFTDVENNNGDIINGAWRENDVYIQGIQPCNVRRATIEAYEQRDKLTNYFLTPEGEIPWQYEYVRRGQNRNRM